MTLYQKFIAPILCYPAGDYSPRKKYLEDPVVWYTEDKIPELQEKYKHLNNGWNMVGFDEQYEPYVEKPKFKKLKVPASCKDCQSCNSTVTGSAYCHMESITFNNVKDPAMSQTVNSFIEDINKRPDWCPIVKVNRELDAMPINSRSHLNLLITGLSELFGSADQWEEEQV